MKIKLKNILEEFVCATVEIIHSKDGRVTLIPSEVYPCARMLLYGYTYEVDYIFGNMRIFKNVPFHWGNRYVNRFTYNTDNSKVTIYI